jgi:hypothetical protein
MTPIITNRRIDSGLRPDPDAAQPPAGLGVFTSDRRDLRVRDWLSRAGEDHSDDSYNDHNFAGRAGTIAAYRPVGG